VGKSLNSWKATVQSGTKHAEQNLIDCMKQKRVVRKFSSADQMVMTHTCSFCFKNCHSRIGLHSHARRCIDRT
jgi:hypothetical protein